MGIPLILTKGVAENSDKVDSLNLPFDMYRGKYGAYYYLDDVGLDPTRLLELGFVYSKLYSKLPMYANRYLAAGPELLKGTLCTDIIADLIDYLDPHSYDKYDVFYNL